MKRILCLSDGLMQGGAERQLIGLAHLLKNQGYCVTLACYTDDIFYSDIIKECELKLIRLTPRQNFLSKIMSVYKFLIREKFDCVIAYKDGATSIACICKILGLPYKLIVSERNTTQKLSYRERIKFTLYSVADYIVPNSYTQGDFITKHYPRYKAKIRVITNFTDLSKFTPSDCVLNSDKLRILTVGRVANQKNIFRYLHAVKRVVSENKRIQFRWVGAISVGQDDYYNQCVKYIEKNGISENFVFVPATQNITEEYLQCDVFCLPSIYEGYPNVVCEAMACGKPILCSNICDNKYIIEDGINGYLFDPIKESDIVEKINKLCQLPSEKIIEMGRRSREIVLNKCSTDRFVDKYKIIIEM